MNNVMILGDPHIGGSLSIGKIETGSFFNSRINDQFEILDWVLNTAIESFVGNIIITGDVFEDPKPPTALISLFLDWLNSCRYSGINVHIIVGNHDTLRIGSVYSSPLDIVSRANYDNVYVYNEVSHFNIKNTSFVLCPYRDRKSLFCEKNEDAVESIKNILHYEENLLDQNNKKVLIGHIAIEGSIFVGDEVADISNELFLPISFLSNFNFTWMGHVHKPQVLNKNPHIAHIGSMDISNFGEVDHKKIVVIYDCDNNSFTTKDIPTRKLKNINILVPKDVEDSTKYVLSEIEKIDDIKDAIVKVSVNIESSDTKSINKSTIQKLISSNGAFNVPVISETKQSKIIKKDKVKDISKLTENDPNKSVDKGIDIFVQNFVPDEIKTKVSEKAKQIHQKYLMELK